MEGKSAEHATTLRWLSNKILIAIRPRTDSIRVMKVSDFNYQLPPELIAQYPPEQRSASRLLKVRNANEPEFKLSFEDAGIADIVSELQAGDLMVLNNTKVIPARLFGKKATGGRVEILLERITDDHQFIAQIRASKSTKEGAVLFVDGDDSVTLTVQGRHDSFFEISSNQDGSLFDWFERVGHMPLPPYIERVDDHDDVQRYQTVFAKTKGAVAAPTAGLHYDQSLLDEITAKGIKIVTITLHVGAGTYQPVRVELLEEHVMHSEYIDVGQDVCDAIMQTKKQGGKVLAVGTTVVRSLESAAQAAKNDLIEPFQGDTDIFITPGFNFKVVDKLQTNFHLPESTLLMLVSAFSGYDTIMNAYQHAINQQYRFFSYGDAMLLDKQIIDKER